MIKNLLFDLGGVIMDIRRQNCVDAFKRLGMPHPEDMLGEYSQKGPFMRLEEGMIDAAEFRREICELIPSEVTDSEIDEAFCRFLTGIPVERLRSLEKLHGTDLIFLLSNTNPIMWHSRIASEFRKDGHDLPYYFDGAVTSFEARSMKPDRRIFDHAVQTLGIHPEETLFFDDSEANVKAARELGFQAEVVAPGAEFADILAAHLKN